jgi:pilus assembly protein FimV
VVDGPRELSVEELMDLEQQADFFLVIGQDHSAIELLMSHVRNDGGINPLPYIKLLEIYQRRGDEEDYERIRERFSRRFNSCVPEWGTPLDSGHELANYPAVISQLQAIWASHAQALEMMDGLLFRRQSSEEIFDLPAYRELLLLHSMARDLAHEAATSSLFNVDVLLPIGRGLADTSSSRPSSADVRPGAEGVDLEVFSDPEIGQIEELESRYSVLYQSSAR